MQKWVHYSLINRSPPRAAPPCRAEPSSITSTNQLFCCCCRLLHRPTALPNVHGLPPRRTRQRRRSSSRHQQRPSSRHGGHSGPSQPVALPVVQASSALLSRWRSTRLPKTVTAPFTLTSLVVAVAYPPIPHPVSQLYLQSAVASCHLRAPVPPTTTTWAQLPRAIQTMRRTTTTRRTRSTLLR